MRKRHGFRPGVWDRLEVRITPSAVGLASPAEIIRIDAHVHETKRHPQHKGRHRNHPAGGITVGSSTSSEISVTVSTSTGGSGIPASDHGTGGGGTSGGFTGGPHPVLSLGGIGVSLSGTVVSLGGVSMAGRSGGIS